ncbi:hypothetical protein BH11MYX4_BH11MYX4_46540 [soil metagenome]
MLANSEDQGFHEDLVSTAALAVGTYFVRVTASTFTPPAAGKEKYVLWVSFE